MVDASVSYGASGGGVFDARTGGLIGLVEGYRTARVTSHGAEPDGISTCPNQVRLSSRRWRILGWSPGPWLRPDLPHEVGHAEGVGRTTIYCVPARDQPVQTIGVH